MHLFIVAELTTMLRISFLIIYILASVAAHSQTDTLYTSRTAYSFNDTIKISFSCSLSLGLKDNNGGGCPTPEPLYAFEVKTDSRWVDIPAGFNQVACDYLILKYFYLRSGSFEVVISRWQLPKGEYRLKTIKEKPNCVNGNAPFYEELISSCDEAFYSNVFSVK
jgi:hypothetical protein